MPFPLFPQLAGGLRSPGTGHAVDLGYLFDEMKGFELYFPKGIILDSAEALRVRDAYQGTLAQFAKTGNPSRGVGRSPATWPRYDVSSRQYMALSATPEARSRVFAKRMSLWQDFLPSISG